MTKESGFNVTIDFSSKCLFFSTVSGKTGILAREGGNLYLEEPLS